MHAVWFFIIIEVRMLKKIIVIVILFLMFLGSTFRQSRPLEDIINNFLAKFQITYNEEESWCKAFGTDIRTLYYKFIGDIGIIVVEKSLGQKVFVKGPHCYGVMNFDAITDFGHYNPDFLNVAFNTISGLRTDKMFTYYGQMAYDNIFKLEVRYYYEAYNYLNIPYNEKIKFTNTTIAELIDVYKRKMNNYNDFWWLDFIPFSQFMDEHGYGLGGSKKCSFWIRRKIDGTDKEFYRIINILIDTFDKEFKKNAVF